MGLVREYTGGVLTLFVRYAICIHALTLLERSGPSAFGCRHSPVFHLILARAKVPDLLRSALLACQPITAPISGEHNARRAKFHVSHSLAENQKGLSSVLVHFISRETYLEVTFVEKYYSTCYKMASHVADSAI